MLLDDFEVHPFHEVHRGLEVEPRSKAFVFLAVFLTDIGMLDKKIDLVGEVPGVAVLIDVDLGVDREGGDARELGVGEDRRQADGDRLKARDRFDVDASDVTIDVHHVEEFDHLVMRMEAKDRRVGAEFGVFLISKPLSRQTMSLCLDWLKSARERLRQSEKTVLSVEEKIAEIRLVNKAKWILMSELKMSEPDAHRYIEKSAMDRCITKKQTAKEIIETFIGMIKREITDDIELEKLEDAIAFKNVANMPARVKCALLAWHTLEGILKNE